MRKELITHEDPKSPVSEMFRTLRTNIQFMNTDERIETILISTQHLETVSDEQLKKDIVEKVIKQVIPQKMIDEKIIPKK